MKKLNKLLITGAAGNLGVECRQRLKYLAKNIRVSDKVDLDSADQNEEVVICDLNDSQAVIELVKDCDGILHLGGKSIEGPWEVVRDSNINGVVNLYEAARKSGKPRIIFASSNHAIGCYPQTELLDSTSPTRPDSLYGVSKVFGEAIASMYHDKFGIETACIRIGSCFNEPMNHRMLSTWLSHEDFVQLIDCIFSIPILGCPIIYGASNSVATWWDNRNVSYLGWNPKDNSEKFRAKLDEKFGQPKKDDPNSIYQGGAFVTDGIHED